MSEDKSGWDSIFSPERIQHFGMKALLTLSEQLLEMFHRRWPHLFFCYRNAGSTENEILKSFEVIAGIFLWINNPSGTLLSRVDGCFWTRSNFIEVYCGDTIWSCVFFAQQKYRWIKHLVEPCFVEWKMVQILPPPPLPEWSLKNIYRRYLLSQPCCWRLVSFIVTKYGYGTELATNTSKEHSLNLSGCNVVVWTKSCPHLVSTGIGQFILGS